MSDRDVVKFGDTFYLKHESGQYLVNVDRGRYNWPQLGNTGKVALRLFGGEGEVQPDSKIKIQTTEEVTGNNNILGAFADSHDCYYWQDGYDEDKQSWRITKASGEAGPICYGDRVRISNISYSNQRLAPDIKNQGYITTVENVGDSWILESAAVKPVAQPGPVVQEPISVRSAAQPGPVVQEPISVRSAALPTPDQVTNQYQVQIQRGGSWQEDGMWAIGNRSDSGTDVISMYATSDDGGQTLHGTLSYGSNKSGSQAYSFGSGGFRATRSSGNDYTVETRKGDSWKDRGTWVLGSRTDKHVIAINVKFKDGGQTLNGTITYQGEAPISFKGVRVEGGAATSVAAANTTTTQAPQPTASTVVATDNTVMKDKIKHVVVVMLENRGFDSVLGYLYEKDGDKPKRVIAKSGDRKEFHGLSFLSPEEFQSLGNPLVDEHGKPLVDKDGKPLVDKDGKPIEQKPVKGVRATNSPGWDPGEPYEHVNMQLFSQKSPPKSGDVPAMKGFVKDYSTECKGDAEAKKQIMYMYTPADLPVLSSLAKSYAVSDMWFASVPSQTNTNRAFSICGTSMGLVDNDFLAPNIISEKLRFADDRFKTDTIWNVLDRNNIHDWAIFWHGVFPPTSHYPYTRNLFPHLENIPNIDSHFHKMEEFFAKAEANQLPAFSYIEPSWGGEVNKLGFEGSIMGNEYHCPADVTPGEHLLQRIYQSLTKNQAAWNQTLLVILFDEHGGTYDHVPPPWGAKPPWGSKQPGFELQHGFQFDRFGVRIPAILVSPLIEERTVFRSTTNTPYDHTSLSATILKWKGIPNTLGERVGNAPTFDQVLTRTTPRTDHQIFTAKSASIATPLKFGDPFCLKHKSGEDVIGAYSGKRYYFPRLDKSGNAVNLDFRFGSGEVKSGATVQIHTSEYLEPNATTKKTIAIAKIRNFAGIRNFLGTWDPDVPGVPDPFNSYGDCYYYSTDDQEDYKEQYWTVSKVDGSAGSICYGDKVYITSNYRKGQRLSKRDEWLTTALNAEDSWVIEPPIYQQTAQQATRETAKVGS